MALPISKLPKRIHLIGIGGDGMGALAHYLADSGFEVSGSDLQASSVIQELIARGLRIAIGHDEKYLQGVECVVMSDAVLNTNCEAVEARLRDLPILTRAQCIAFLAKEKESIYVAGAHGKSTTSAILAHILRGWDSSTSFILGANVASLENCRAQRHSGQYLIVEACEAFGNLEPLFPSHVILTNVDDEHLNHYGSQSRLDRAFSQFLERTLKGGSIVVSGDDPGIMRILSPKLHESLEASGITITRVGFESHNQVQISNYEWCDSFAQFDLALADPVLAHLQMPLPGLHNACNAALAVVMAYGLGVPLEILQESLRTFHGIERRWQDYGLIGRVHLVDDYAHHPAELNALLNTATNTLSSAARKILIYQPQLISRTKRVLEQTAHSLAQWDEIFLLEIDAAGESNPDGLSSSALGDLIIQSGGGVKFFEDVEDVANRFDRYVKSGDALIVAGAGQIRQLAPMLQSKLELFPDRQYLSGSETSLSHKNGTSDLRMGFLSVFKRAIRERIDNFRWHQFRQHSSQSVRDLFEWHLDHRPHDLALMGPDYQLSYRQLDSYANSLAHQFRVSGVQAGDVVGIHLGSSAALVASVLALSKLGAIYLPLDINLPVKRIIDLMRLSSTRFLVSLKNAFFFEAIPQSIGLIKVDVTKQSQKILEKEKELEPLVAIELQGSDLTYICFTSGTTGTPKGVPVAQSALHNVIKQLIERFSLSKSSRMLINTGIGFDVSLAELWLALAGGGSVVVTDEDHALVGPRLADFIEEMKISHMAATPSVLRTVPQRVFSDLKCLVLAGEVCRVNLVNQWACSGRQVWNAYGPTEAAIYSTVSLCKPDAEVTIGKPLSGINTYVVDVQKQELMAGYEGELLIGGKGVSSGYLSPDIDQSAFFSWEVDGKSIDWVYRTGDRVSQNSKGELVYLGRKDAQIKLNGVRIELGEVESVLRTQEGVADAVVALDVSGNHEQLVAFLLPVAGAKLSVQGLREGLTDILPNAMLPSEILLVPEIPLNLSGKVDRQKLLDQRRSLSIVRPFFDPGRSATEKDLVRIWEKILQYQPIGIYDEFFTLGGDSLKILLLQDEIESAYQIDLPPGFLSDLRNITNLAVMLDEWISSSKVSRHQNNFRFEDLRIYQQVHEITSSWQGIRHRPADLIHSLGQESATHDLFVCLQYEEELVQLHDALGPDYRVHGMRSGHLVMTYTPENVKQLAARYCDELIRIASSGKVIIAGICQGGAIAHAMAMLLYEKTGTLPPLVFIEQARFPKYPGRSHFFYSQQSFLNPMNKFHRDLSRLDEIYEDRYTFDVVSGDHGSITRMPFVQEFVFKFDQYFSSADLLLPSRDREI